MGRADAENERSRSPDTSHLTSLSFEDLGFAEPLSRALLSCAYTTPTPIQAQAIPSQLANRDLLALAETGSGKTAAFVLPLLQALHTSGLNPASRQVSALILAPTRELAVQIDAEVKSLGRNMRLRRAVVLGGVGKGGQIQSLRQGVHVLVATPGRLLDLIQMGCCDLSRVQTLVLDEADRMFDMGFIRDIRKIASMLPRQRRTAMFSATMPDEIRKLASELLDKPVTVDLSPKQIVVDRIDQQIMIVPAKDKQDKLHAILKSADCSRVIVFTRTKRGADRVSKRLESVGIGSAAIHGNKAQNARQRALADFSEGRVRVLVATDIAARGIDVSEISHVVNFDMPMEAETYVHRIGRTARKGTSGIAISLCDPSERQLLAAIEKLMKRKIAVIGGGDVSSHESPVPGHQSRPPQRNRSAPVNDGRRDNHQHRHREHAGDRQGARHADTPRGPNHRSSNRHADAPAAHTPAQAGNAGAAPSNREAAWSSEEAPKFLRKGSGGGRSWRGPQRATAR